MMQKLRKKGCRSITLLLLFFLMSVMAGYSRYSRPLSEAVVRTTFRSPAGIDQAIGTADPQDRQCLKASQHPDSDGVALAALIPGLPKTSGLGMVRNHNHPVAELHRLGLTIRAPPVFLIATVSSQPDRDPKQLTRPGDDSLDTSRRNSRGNRSENSEDKTCSHLC